ncbi:uncharacterized protein LOC134824967 isoform X2 [Bolinopsis microptera]|uniref:uncharacterized protein LOC134824967 isoform X2 n=1 Tax=Bolinopsis microptera TaxID=2820187 RepID=UPI00307AFAC2
MIRLITWLGVILLPNIVSAFKCVSSVQTSKEADSMSCSKFYLCNQGVPESQECGEQDTFDVLYRMCRAAEVVKSCSYAPRDCYIEKGSGFDYQGNVSVTTSGLACIPWRDSLYSFNRHKLSENFCRNPNPDTYDKPWCPTDDPNVPQEECNIPTCSGSSASFNGRGYLAFNTGTGTSTSTYDLEASYEERILMYIRPTDTDTSSVLFQMSSQSDDQTYYVKLYKKVITVYAWLEAGGTMAKANTWIDLADGQSHKIAIERRLNKIFLRVDDGPEHYSQLPGLTDKFMLPMSVEVGKSFKGCISSLDIITKNAQGKRRHHEPLDKLAGVSTDEQISISTEGSFDDGFTTGCMLTPKFSEIILDTMDPTTPTPTEPPTNNGTVSEVSGKSNKDLFIILACVIGAALIILLVVLVIVCRSRNKDKGVYKLKETKQFDWEYGNLPPTSKNSLVRESEHGV